MHKRIAGLLLLFSWIPTHAATLATWDLTANAGGNQASYQFATPVGAVAPLEVHAFSDIDNTDPNGQLTSSSVFGRDDGLGVCNPSEDLLINLVIFQLPIPCSIRANAQPADNAGQRDWLLIYLPGESTNEWVNVVLNGQGSLDMDVSYWVGTINSAADLNNVSYNSLGSVGFGSRVDVAGDNVDDGNGGIVPISIDLGNAQGNALLIGGNFNETDDGVLAASVTALVPIPPTLVLLGSALLALGWRSRRSA